MSSKPKTVRQTLESIPKEENNNKKTTTRLENIEDVKII